MITAMRRQCARIPIFFETPRRSRLLRLRVNAWRELRGVTLAQVSEATGIPFATVRQALRPKSGIRLRRTFYEAIEKMMKGGRND